MLLPFKKVSKQAIAEFEIQCLEACKFASKFIPKVSRNEKAENRLEEA